MTDKIPDLIPAVAEGHIRYPTIFPTEGAVRHAIATRDANGCAEHKVFVKLRRQWFIRNEGLESWINAQIEAA